MRNNNEELLDDMELDITEEEHNNTEEEYINEEMTDDNEKLSVESEEDDIPIEESIESEESRSITEEKSEDTVEEKESIQNETPKDKKAKKKKKKKGAKDDEPIVKTDVRLYILTDSVNLNIADYFQSYGISIAHIYNDIAQFANELIFEDSDYKVVVLETGSTRFISSKKREELINAIGMCNSKEDIEVFYTDAVIKSDLKYSKGTIDKSYNWHKYKSTVDTLIELLRLTEKYNFIGSFNGNKKSQVEFDKVKGKESGSEEDIRYSSILSMQDIKINMVNEVDNSEELEKFNVKNFKFE